MVGDAELVGLADAAAQTGEHITLEQARNYLQAILKGDPDALSIVKASLKELLA